MKARITDIAKKAGVSISAVSLALNKKDGVSQKTAQKILHIARELNYPIPLIDVDSTTIVLVKIVKHAHILNSDHNIFIGGYIEGIEKECSASDIRLEIMSCKFNDFEEIVSTLNDREHAKLDGAIILATELDYKDIIQFEKIKISICFIDANYSTLPFSFVDIDNVSGVDQAVSYLAKLGHKKIGIVGSSFPSPNFLEREQSFKMSLSYKGLEYNQKYNFKVDSTLSQSYLDMKAILKEKTDFPTALFCVNDIIAYGCMKALQEQGWKIPQDISIIGFDDLPSSQICTPSLSSIRIPTIHIGTRAAQLLAQRISSGIAAFSERISIGGNLVPRESVRTRA